MLIAIYFMFSLPYRRGTGFSLLFMVWTMCSSLVFLSRFSFRPTNLLSSFSFRTFSFSFLNSNLIVSLFLLVKPDLTRHVIKIMRIDRSSWIFIYTWLSCVDVVFGMLILKAVSRSQRHNDSAILQTSRKSLSKAVSQHIQLTWQKPFPMKIAPEFRVEIFKRNFMSRYTITKNKHLWVCIEYSAGYLPHDQAFKHD